MRITKTQLKRIIKEEIVNEVSEGKWTVRGQPASRAEAAAYLASTDEEDAGDDGPGFDPRGEEDTAESDILDAIQMLENEEDPNGTLFHVINRLHTALEKI